MGFKDSITFMKRLWILLFLSLLITPNKSIAQPDTLELHRIWVIDLDHDITALRLADLDGDGTNEIFVGLWYGDSGYVEVFSGFNGIFLQRSQKIDAHKVSDLDVGDIDGDQNLDLVVGTDKSVIWVLSGEQMYIQWQRNLVGIIKNVEVEDIDQDDTAEIFVGTAYRSYEWTGGHSSWFSWEKYSGNLYFINPEDTTTTKIDASKGYWKLVAHDIDQDLYSELVCVTFYGYGMVDGVWDPPSEYGEYSENSHIFILDQDTSLHSLSTLWDKWIFWPWVEVTPLIMDIAIGNCDLDEAKEIVSHIDCGEEDWASGLILSVTDASTGIVENSCSYEDSVVGLELFDANAQAPDEILIAHSSGLIQALDGITFDTLAINDALPPISFFAFKDVTGDALPEICISDGDSLFVYSTPVTAVGEENQENLSTKFNLNQNYPNPFNAQTTIKYYLPQNSRVELSIYNIKGQKVKTLVDGFQSTGFKNVTWDSTNRNGEQVASGVYFYKIKTDYSQEIKKMVLLK